MFSSILPPKIVRVNDLMDIQEAFGVFTDLMFCIGHLLEYRENRPEFRPMVEAFVICLEGEKVAQRVIKERLVHWMQGL